jgi:hypothetical protein
MPVDAKKALEQWYRYQFVRDHGHATFVRKADRCTDFFVGMQWDKNDVALLNAQRRPALTINKILSTIGNVLGEQIQNRTDISFQPRSGAPIELAETITKVFRQIADNNQLDWKRSDMFCDGIVTSRGYLDVRLDFTDSMMGEVKVENINPKNVLVDPDAEEYDPDTWNDVMVTKWMTPDDIEILYNKADAQYLRARGSSSFLYGFDSVERDRDRFGFDYHTGYDSASTESKAVSRNIRVIERQWRKLDRVKHFVDLKTGDMRPIPETWNEEKIQYVATEFGLGITSKLVKRIRWTVTADNVVLHDEWSPYKHFTVIPYFPYFQRGRTVGLVENLLDPQEYLNKVTSQELHVINTTANSGWIVGSGKLRNMTIEELEQRGAETGLVLEVDGSPKDAVEKINPNQTPTGLDRFSYKAEEHIKTISGVTDYQTGNAREDVSAKAVALNQDRGAMNLGRPLDSLARTDFILARHVLAIVQEFYTEPRILNITSNRLVGETEEIAINQPDPVTGDITNDLTIGEYDIIVSSTPARETLEDSQFEQAVSLRELGIQLPDDILIENSRLNKRGEIIKQMREQTQTAEAQYADELAKLQAELELSKTRAEAARVEADAALKQAKAQEVMHELQLKTYGDPAERQRLQLEMQEKIMTMRQQAMNEQAEARRREEEFQQTLREMERKLLMQQEQHDQKLEQNEEMHDQKMEHAQEQNEVAIKAKKAQASQNPSKEKA